jgi:hypothetical protein
MKTNEEQGSVWRDIIGLVEIMRPHRQTTNTTRGKLAN